MTRRERPILGLGLLAFCTGTVVLLLAFMLGFPLFAPHATADSVKAQRMSVPAAVALVTGAVALAGRRRGWAFALGCVGVAAAVVAVLLTVLLPDA